MLLWHLMLPIKIYIFIYDHGTYINAHFDQWDALSYIVYYISGKWSSGYNLTYPQSKRKGRIFELSKVHYNIQITTNKRKGRAEYLHYPGYTIYRIMAV